MSIHKEISFEDGICNELKANGWFYEDKDATGFVRGLCLYPADCQFRPESEPEFRSRVGWHGFRKRSRTHGSFWSRIMEPPLRILS